ncbi:FAD-dependent oxidoreductase (plasmid) [Photobacterium sp. GJ3]|nr:FAD-dependent oxidoreductase [Photobacterium sp. GJ3]
MTDASNKTPNNHLKIGVIGGGMAGSTIALRLAEQGFAVSLFEAGPSLVNGPPICHLHAGGNLYRDISDQQCLQLLEQSIETLRVYPHSANIRPTVIAVPRQDPEHPEHLIPRLNLLKQRYQALVTQDECNAVLGHPDEYFRLYSREDMERLAQRELPDYTMTADDWMIPVARHLDLNNFQYPFVLVQEYGVSVFRLAATVSLALDALGNCQVHTSTQVTDLAYLPQPNQWRITYQSFDVNKADVISREIEVDYVINACGYRTGTLDNLASQPRQRLVEFKAAYVTHWQDSQADWPEVIFHGQRGTPEGMAQLTPYPDGYFQLHGMTPEITLFQDGLVRSTATSAQPELGESFKTKLKSGWQPQEAEARTQRAIDHLAQFIPAYQSAVIGGPPLFGAQQIPGDDPSLRAADVSFAGQRYARAEIVKASSALAAAERILEQLVCEGIISESASGASNRWEERFSITQQLSLEAIVEKAEQLAAARCFPTALALPVGQLKTPVTD